MADFEWLDDFVVFLMEVNLVSVGFSDSVSLSEETTFPSDVSSGVGSALLLLVLISDAPASRYGSSGE